MRQKNKPQDQQRPTLSGWDQVRASDVRIGLLSEADVPTATARTATPQQMRWKASGEKEGRRRETKWRPSLRETLRKDRATGLGAGLTSLRQCSRSESETEPRTSRGWIGNALDAGGHVLGRYVAAAIARELMQLVLAQLKEPLRIPDAIPDQSGIAQNGVGRRRFKRTAHD